jgi:hypothetical protein
MTGLSQGCSFGWPVYSVFDEVKSFDCEIETGFYYFNTNNFFSFKGAGWYYADLVYYGCECKIITNKNILLQYKSSDTLNTDNLKTFIDEVYNFFDNSKYAFNTLIGIFGHNYKSCNIHHFTQDSRLVLCELEQNKDAKVRYIYKSEFMNDNKDDQFIDMDNFNPDNHMKTLRPAWPCSPGSGPCSPTAPSFYSRTGCGRRIRLSSCTRTCPSSSHLPPGRPLPSVSFRFPY